jgi:hypothetical protein
MKRSEINEIVRRGCEFLAECRFHLPPFAYWTPAEWEQKGHEADEIRQGMLGWDVTDLGKGDFENTGLLLFTLRNGSPGGGPNGKTYCEKIMISRPGQHCSMHFHWQKTEDIINRAGGDLVIRLHGSTEAEDLDREDPVQVSMDGVVHRVPAGGTVRLQPGESITLTPGLYHEFWAEGGPVLAGEVSTVNDDAADNRFAEPIGRFPGIEEDEPPLYYLCTEYPAAD